MKKTLLIIVVLVIVGLIGWQVYQKVMAAPQEGERRRRAPKVAVEIGAVETSSIKDIRDFTGTLLPKSQFTVAPKIGGRLKNLNFNIGDPIRQGQLIAVLDDEEHIQQVDQARAELEVARANFEESKNSLQIARREYDRTVVLREKKIASESELDNAMSRYRTQEAKVKVTTAQMLQKEAALKVAEVRLSYTRIKMPSSKVEIQGVVGERFVHEGALLAPNNPIISILDIQSVIAVIHVIERDYAKIKIGMNAEISTDAFPDKRFQGKIIRMAPLLKEKSREARVEIEIPNKARLLKPGMFVRVRIEYDHHQNVTVVPIASLLKREGRTGVFIVDKEEEKARFVEVKTGIINGSQAEILEPSLSGYVVTLGHHLLEKESGVILPDEQPQDRKKSPGGTRPTEMKKRPSTKSDSKQGGRP